MASFPRTYRPPEEPVKTTPLVLGLTVVNLGLLAFEVLRLPRASADDPAGAGAPQEPPILRGRGLEIVDADGHVRAQIKVEPADPTYRWPDGSRVGTLETVILRLATADGKPRVKLTTSTDGAALMLLGSTDTTHAVLKGEGGQTSLLLRNDASKQKVVVP